MQPNRIPKTIKLKAQLLHDFVFWGFCVIWGAILAMLRVYSWLGAQMTIHMWCQGLNPGILHARQIPHVVYYPFSSRFGIVLFQREIGIFFSEYLEIKEGYQLITFPLIVKILNLFILLGTSYADFPRNLGASWLFLANETSSSKQALEHVLFGPYSAGNPVVLIEASEMHLVILRDI